MRCGVDGGEKWYVVHVGTCHIKRMLMMLCLGMRLHISIHPTTLLCIPAKKSSQHSWSLLLALKSYFFFSHFGTGKNRSNYDAISLTNEYRPLSDINVIHHCHILDSFARHHSFKLATRTDSSHGKRVSRMSCAFFSPLLVFLVGYFVNFMNLLSSNYLSLLAWYLRQSLSVVVHCTRITISFFCCCGKKSRRSFPYEWQTSLALW